MRVHPHHGAIDGQQAQSLRIQLSLNGLVQGLEHGRIQLLAGLAEGRGGHVTGLQGSIGDLLEEAVQFGLQGGLGLVEQEQHQMLEGQVAVAGEILTALTVLGDKGGTIKQVGYFMYNFWSGPGWGCQPLAFVGVS